MILVGKAAMKVGRSQVIEGRWGEEGKQQQTFNLQLICLWIPHQQRGGFTIERIGRVRVAQQLRKEDLEDVDHVEHGRPGLVYDVEADGAAALR